MATEILAVGSSDANSADVTVEAGESLTVALKDTAGPVISAGCLVHLLLKDDDGQYFLIDKLSAQKPAVVIIGAGTYRFSRKNAPGSSCGVFSA